MVKIGKTALVLAMVIVKLRGMTWIVHKADMVEVKVGRMYMRMIGIMEVEGIVGAKATVNILKMRIIGVGGIAEAKAMGNTMTMMIGIANINPTVGAPTAKVIMKRMTEKIHIEAIVELGAVKMTVRMVRMSIAGHHTMERVVAVAVGVVLEVLVIEETISTVIKATEVVFIEEIVTTVQKAIEVVVNIEETVSVQAVTTMIALTDTVEIRPLILHQEQIVMIIRKQSERRTVGVGMVKKKIKKLILPVHAR